MNILIVDDEDYVLDYLTDCIRSMDLSIQQILTATSVDDALTIINEDMIAIVITDIRMPEKSGLDLLEILSETNPMTKTILLSGYSEFEFAKTAILYNAVDYLLKPITSEELEKVLNKVINEINTENKKRQDLYQIKNIFKINTCLAREQLLLDLFHGKNYPKKEFLERLNFLQLDNLLDEPSIIATFQLTSSSNDKQSQDKFDLFASTILNLIEELFYEDLADIPNLWSCRDYYQLVHTIIPLKLVNYNLEIALDKLNKFSDIVKKHLHMNVTVFITNQFSFNQGLHSYYLKILNYYLKNLAAETNTIQVIDDKSTTYDYQTLTKFNDPPTILHLMENNQWQEVSDKINVVLTDLDQLSCYSYSQLIEIYYYLYSCFSYKAHKSNKDISSLINNLTIGHNPFVICSTDQIREWSQTMIEHFKHQIKENERDRSFIITLIQTFIQHNLGSDLSLKRISEHVYLHPVYLSRMYKEETGENISTYILRMKMERAVVLLTTTNKKVSEISQEIGYQKTQYFIKLFKETYQTTPQNYRNIHVYS